MPHASTRALGKDPKDRRRKDGRAEGSDMSRIRHEMTRDTTAATRAGGATTVAARVNALTSPPVAPPRDNVGRAERTAREQARDRQMSLATIEESRRRVVSALALACDDHHAQPGDHCWGSAVSGVQGICIDRYRRGLRGLPEAANSATKDPASLAPYATAVRNAQRDARLRPIHGHPERGPIVPAGRGGGR
jgi:hypothetical protein